MKLVCPICNNDAYLEMPMQDEPLHQMLDRIEKVIVIAALKRTYGNQKAASRDLRIEYHALRYLVEKHSLQTETFS